MSSTTTEEFDQRVKSFFEHVDKSVPQYVAELGEAVAIPSVSSGKMCECVTIICISQLIDVYFYPFSACIAIATVEFCMSIP